MNRKKIVAEIQWGIPDAMFAKTTGEAKEIILCNLNKCKDMFFEKFLKEASLKFAEIPEDHPSYQKAKECFMRNYMTLKMTLKMEIDA